MSDIFLNGYIDNEEWFGDEITPDTLRDQLMACEAGEVTRVWLNSYGGSCEAATRMYDQLRAYPGKVHVTVSGCAASAATVLAMGADKLDMTPGSLFMIHDPSTFAFGNVADMNAAIAMLGACKESILNVYAQRCRKLSRDEIAKLMTDTTWMDATAALTNGFVDAIAEDAKEGAADSVKPRAISRDAAERMVAAWRERKLPARARAPEARNEKPDGVSAEQLRKRLDLIK